VYALSSDGLFHTLNQHTGTDILPAVKFIRSNAQAHGLIVVNNMAYTATRNNCGGTPNAVWAIDLTAPNKAMSVVKWESGGASIEGSAGFAFGRDGTIYAATGAGPSDPAGGQYSASIVALDQKTLELKDRFSPAGAGRSLNFSTTPVVLTYKDKEYIAAGGVEGRLYLLDATGLGGSDHETPLHKTTVYSGAKAGAGALATWEDADGTRWVLAPAAGPVMPETKFPVTNGDAKNGSVVAFKVVEENGKPALQPAWVSRDLVSPAPPVVVNGVVFALSSGEYMAPTASAATAEQRAQRSVPAVLYALDASTGKELWNSGKAIASFSHSGGLAVGGSKIFVSTADSTLYAFGYLLPRD
jgi:outer membrane protein assembly factor BamB